MLKILVECWNKNKDKLQEKLKNTKMCSNYKDLVKLTFDFIYNISEGGELATEDITEIDNGSYQGTLLYLIPFDTCQPSEYEYLMTYARYGSCSVCDTLRSIDAINYDSEFPNEEQVKELMILCKDIIQNTVKPYDFGWRKDEKWKRVEGDE